jgi:hypothetical protein
MLDSWNAVKEPEDYSGYLPDNDTDSWGDYWTDEHYSNVEDWGDYWNDKGDNDLRIGPGSHGRVLRHSFVQSPMLLSKS